VNAWSDWKPLLPPSPLGDEVLAELLDGGQSFRWTATRSACAPPRGAQADFWTGVWGPHAARLRRGAAGGLEWSAPLSLASAAGPALAHYLDAAAETRAAVDALPWRSDPHLARCLAAFPGLRLLRQPLGETLLGFLCSATKQIVQIKQMLALLAERHGRPLAEGLPYRRLPTWEEIAALSEADLRACRLGFRAGHIHRTARRLAAQPGWLEETGALPYAEARLRLCQLPGVGEKVADCVLLFGAGREEAFPVDVWILRAMSRHYGLAGWKPAQIAHFGRAHFGPAAGLAQQYLFAWERREKMRK
jgi:N-glycosylase/DNA lyase